MGRKVQELDRVALRERVVLLGCVLTGSTSLDASTIFIILASLRSMSELVRMIPDALSMMIQVKVSLDRLDTFFLDDELKDYDNLKRNSLEVKRGQKVAFCGPVGAGKSSLLYAILGEIPKVSGSVMEDGRITQSGSYEQLLTAGIAFEQLVNAHKEAMTVFDPENSENFGESRKNDSDRSEESTRPYLTKETSEGEILIKGTPGIQLTEDEEKEIGDVGWKLFYDYILVSEGSLFLGVSMFAQSAFPISTLFAYLRPYYAALLGLKASKSFFSSFTNSVFKAPMLFFESTPIGRILTRYDGSGNVCSHILKIFKLVLTLKELSLTIDDTLMVHLAVWYLPKSLEIFQVHYQNKDKTWEINELIAALVSEEEQQKKGKAKSAYLTTSMKKLSINSQEKKKFKNQGSVK
ncbi:hypothetical protein GIB67_040981 [Kingdonia uniflora]|uniref:ABC transmembrane type-1 domain-containing protein n=1 Tax=Kingdonia uniflora TaxID=39325 RepID=A0A7J7NBT9_9MAGN|nr:hypothetical protein GIB67_040981 [Kingdonia uniflora]